MLTLTRIFHFEMAHALYGYPGDCRYIHGHSYALHVTVIPADGNTEYIPAPGFVIDFKEFKNLVQKEVINKFDHKLALSPDFLATHPSFSSQENLLVTVAEPSAENLLITIKQALQKALPKKIKLLHLKLYETRDSYASWLDNPQGKIDSINSKIM